MNVFVKIRKSQALRGSSDEGFGPSRASPLKASVNEVLRLGGIAGQLAGDAVKGVHMGQGFFGEGVRFGDVGSGHGGNLRFGGAACLHGNPGKSPRIPGPAISCSSGARALGLPPVAPRLFQLPLDFLYTLVQASHLLLQLLKRPKRRQDGLHSLVERVLHLLELFLGLIDERRLQVAYSPAYPQEGTGSGDFSSTLPPGIPPGMSLPIGPSRRSASTFSVRA